MRAVNLIPIDEPAGQEVMLIPVDEEVDNNPFPKVPTGYQPPTVPWSALLPHRTSRPLTPSGRNISRNLHPVYWPVR